MSRKKLIAANWKMYKTPDQTSEFFRNFLPSVWDHTRDEIAICPPYLDIPTAVEAAKDSNVGITPRTCSGKKKAPTRAKFPPA